MCKKPAKTMGCGVIRSGKIAKEARLEFFQNQNSFSLDDDALETEAGLVGVLVEGRVHQHCSAMAPVT